MDSDVLLEVANVCKTFPGVKALDNVSLKLRRGTVHALCGENGAGKSTLMNILIGMYGKDSGEIYFKGAKVEFTIPKQALDAGISIIEQELTPIYDMTVAENVFLGREPTKARFINYPKLNEMAKKVLAELEAPIDPTKKMKELSLAEIQLVEIARAISYDSDVIIMDEPTSAIGEKEVEHLFKVIRLMKEKGKGILYVSHRLKEVFTIADEVSVLRDGKLVGTAKINEIDSLTLISMMIGRRAEEDFHKGQTVQSDEALLAVKHFSRAGKLHDISLEVRRGEVLGIFGLMGSGRTEFLHALLGLEPPDAGEVFIEGKYVRIRSPKDAIANGIGIVPEDRKKIGLALTSSVKENISLAFLKRLTHWFLINRRQEKTHVAGIVAKFGIKTPSLEHPVKSLSGGNQQR